MLEFFELGVDLAEMAKTVASIDDKIMLNEAVTAINKLTAENRELSDELAKLRQELARRKELEYRDGSYYLARGDGKLEGPVCRRCYLSEGLINRLMWRRDHELRCTVCDTTYSYGTLGEFDPPPEVTFLEDGI